GVDAGGGDIDGGHHAVHRALGPAVAGGELDAIGTGDGSTIEASVHAVVAAVGPEAANPDVVDAGLREVDAVVKPRAGGQVAGVVVDAGVGRGDEGAGAGEAGRGSASDPALAALGSVGVEVLGFDDDQAIGAAVLLIGRRRVALDGDRSG